MGHRGSDRRPASPDLRSPELAAMLAGRHSDPLARYRRLAGLVGGAAVGVGLLWLVLAWRSPARRPSEPAQEIDDSVYLGPIETQAGEAGEEVAPFAGFALSVDTEPPGALVTIAGVPRGEAPVLASVECRAGDAVEVRAERPGARAARRKVACRADTLVKVTLRVEP